MKLSKEFKIATYKDGKFIKYGYPNRYIDKVVKVDKGIVFYIVEDVQPNVYNTEQYEKKPLDLEITDVPNEDYPHLLVAHQKYELVEYSSAIILKKIDTSLDEWLNNNCNEKQQLQDLTSYLALDFKRNAGIITQEEINELLYIHSKRLWGDECKSEASKRKEEYLNNGVFPDLYNWPEMPIKE